MKILNVEKDVDWIPLRNVVTFVKDSIMPTRRLITSVHVLAFQGDTCLFIEHPERGWNLPGGHIEPKETPSEAIMREAYEEACVKLNHLRIFGHLRIDLLEFDPSKIKYPFPLSYILLFIANVVILDPFQPKYETIGRKLFSPDDAKRLPWVKRFSRLFEEAVCCSKEL